MSSSHIEGNHSVIFVIVISDQLRPRVWGLGSDHPLGTSLLLHLAALGSLIVATGRTAEKTSPQRKSPYRASAYIMLAYISLAKASHVVKPVSGWKYMYREFESQLPFLASNLISLHLSFLFCKVKTVFSSLYLGGWDNKNIASRELKK